MIEVLPATDRLTTAHWRALTRAATDAYLSPKYKPSGFGAVIGLITRKQFLDDPQAAYKAERHAAAGAFIRRVTQELVTGEGAQARFADRYTTAAAAFAATLDPELTAYNRLQLATVRMFSDATTWLEGRKRFSFRPRSHVGSYLSAYESHAKARPSTETITLATLREGNTFPGELVGFVAVTSALLPTDPLTSHLDKEGRVAMSHKLVPAMLGRASTHTDILARLPDWSDVAEGAHIEIGTNDSSALVDEDGVRLFSRALRQTTGTLRTPILMCPAHQVQPDSQETDLMAQMHAGINYAADLGFYD